MAGNPLSGAICSTVYLMFLQPNDKGPFCLEAQADMSICCSHELSHIFLDTASGRNNPIRLQFIIHYGHLVRTRDII